MINIKKLTLIGTIIVALTLVGATCKNSQNTIKNNEPTSQSAVAGASTEYYSDDAKVMEFYSDYCSWCQKEKQVLAELAPSGYKVKSMNVGTNTDLWKQYNIEGTPTFIAPDGTRLVGYQDKEALKAFLDKYK